MSSYVILVREPLDPEEPEKDRPFYMLEVMLEVEDDPYPHIETRQNRTFYQYRVKLVEAPGVEVDEASGKPTTLHIDDDPDNGKIYDDISKIEPWLWTLRATNYEPFIPDNHSGKNSYNGLMNVATGCYLGPAKVSASGNTARTTDYCAAKVALLETDDAVAVFKAFDLSFCEHEAYPNRLASRNMFCTASNQYYWYFLKTEGTAQDGQSYFYLKGERLSSAGQKTLSDAPPEGALEFFFVSDILINGQPPLAEPHQIAGNPYYFHRYSDNPENPAAETEPTADPPAASKTLTARDDGTYDLSLSVTANTREGSFSEGSAEVVLVVDATHSMTQNYAHEKEAAALLEIGGMLMQKNVPIHVVLFSSGAWTDFQTYTSENAEKYEELITVKLRNWIESNESNTSSLGGNTNWEAGMKLGAEVLRQIEVAEADSEDDDVLYKDKYLIFISDGEPNQKLTDEAEYLRPIATLSAFDGGLGYHASDSTGDISRSFTKFTHAREVARQITDGGASVLVVNINFGMEEQSAVMKALAYYAASGGIYGTPPTGTYYEAEATSDDEDKIAGELIAAARFVLRKFLYQDVSLSDGLTDGTALAGATELAPEGAVPDFSYTITLKDGTAYDGELPAGETALRFFRDTEGVRVYLCADGTESADAAKALRLRGADYDSTTRKVNWSIQSAAPGNAAHYMLIEDATYTVSFPVWPTQETYDAISGRENNQADIKLPQGLFPLEEYNYTFDSDPPPTSLSGLLALLEISGADVDSVESGDPAGISVTEASPGDWTLDVAPGLDRPIPLTITLKDGSVIVAYATGTTEASVEKVERHWELSTNTKGTAVKYTPQLVIQENGEPPEWRDFPPSWKEIENPAPVELAAWTVNARKVWMDSGTEHSAIQSLKLHLHQVSKENDNHVYIGEIELTGTGGWLSADFSISPGMMVRRTEETESWGKAVTFDGEPYVLLNEGYGYYFTETLPNSLYPFRLEEDVFYPMLVDGVPVNAQRVTVGESYAYTDVGRLVKPLLAKNRLADAISIEITKQVLDAQGQRVQADGQENGQEENVEFHLTVTLTAPGGELDGFPLLNGDRIVRFGVLDREGANVTAERFPEGNYLTFNGMGVAVGDFPIRDGETVFFPSVPEGTRYKVEEPEASMPEGYVLREIACFIRDADTGDLTAGAANENGYLAQRDQNQVVVTNQIRVEDEKPILPRIVIDKFQTGDNTQKLSGAAFVLYRYPTAEELEADETLGAETPLYYCRPDPDEPPTFTPDKDQALTVITDADGRAEFADLPDGVYYLLETEAPIDYHRLIAPIAVTVDTSWLETAENPTQAQIAAASVFTVHIANTPKTTLPATGGPGPARQAGLAPLLLGVGAAGLVILRRKRKTAGR